MASSDRAGRVLGVTLVAAAVLVWSCVLWKTPEAFGQEPEDTTTTTIVETTTSAPLPESSTTTTVPAEAPVVVEDDGAGVDELRRDVAELGALVSVVGFFVALHVVRDFGRG